MRFSQGIALVGLGLAVPALTVYLSAGPLRASLGLPPAPFALWSLLTVHLLAGLPVCLVIAGLLIRQWPRLATIPTIWPALLGVLVSLAMYAIGPALGVALDDVQLGWIGRSIVRSFLCLILQSPIVFLATRWSALDSVALAPVPGAIAVLATLLLPGCYTWHLIVQQTRRAEEALQAQHLVDAQRSIWGLCDLGSSRAIAGLPPRLALAQVEGTLEMLLTETSAPMPADAGVDRRLDRARRLAVLGKLDEAARLVESLPPADVDGRILLALIRQKQNRFAESDALYRKTLDDSGLPSDRRTEFRTRAFDGLAFNARAEHRFTEAQAHYEEALRLLPEAKAHFHFQLARHFQQAGRSAAARTHLELAATLEPSKFSRPAASILLELRQHSPACVLRN